MKPLGLMISGAGMKVTRPTRAQDLIYSAVEAAISESMTVPQFIAEARECWEVHLENAKEFAMDEFKRAAQ